MHTYKNTNSPMIRGLEETSFIHSFNTFIERLCSCELGGITSEK